MSGIKCTSGYFIVPAISINNIHYAEIAIKKKSKTRNHDMAL